MIERGPLGMVHVPSHRNGCYYHRVEDCCWVCYWRIVWALSRSAREEAAEGLVGRTIEVPSLHAIDDVESIEHVEGEITDVFTTTDAPQIVTVELETGDEITLGVRLTS